METKQKNIIVRKDKMSEQNKKQAKHLRSKERKVTSSYNKANLWWWLCRYVADLQFIDKRDIVIDVGCGCGVGTSILAEKAKTVIGIDDSKESIDFANTYWSRPNIDFFYLDCFQIQTEVPFDVVVAHELIEHVKDTEKLFELFGTITKKYLIFTTPLDTDPIKNKWHWRHLSLKEIKQELIKNGFKLIQEKFMNKQYFVAKKISPKD
jgi:2-polyprenyl-3-methyl-5-hydroxy-6-metoxy-1,4-benzoquinol methylase